MSVWDPVPFIPPHTEDTARQGAYQISRTKGILLVRGRGGVRFGAGAWIRKFISCFCTLCYLPRRHIDNCGEKGDHTMV